MEPLVSIIIPAYNVEKYIDKCIQSVLTQTYKNVEIILVNDGSKDASGAIIQRFARNNSNIVFLDKQNEGVANARNDGIKAANGDYLLFVDADDYIDATYVEDMTKAAIKENSELVISGYTLVHSDERKIKEIIPDEYVQNEKEEWAYRISSTWARLYSRSFWEQHELAFLQEKNARAEDVPIAMYANAMAKNICMIPNAGYYYRQHEESAMHKEGGYFRFPYEAFKSTFESIMEKTCENSIEFFLIGTLKLFAHFEFVIYRSADKKERDVFRKYVSSLLNRKEGAAYKAWKRRRFFVKLPLSHKVLMEFLVIKYRRCKKW